jgi:hypothetical protein
MKKIMIAALGLSLLSGSVVFAHQDTTSTTKKTKKKKKSTSTSTMNTMSSPKK